MIVAKNIKNWYFLFVDFCPGANPINCEEFSFENGKFFIAKQASSNQKEDSDVCASLNAEPADKSVVNSEMFKKFLTECLEELFENKIDFLKLSSENSSYIARTLNALDPIEVAKLSSLDELKGNALCAKSKHPQNENKYYFILFGVGSIFVSVTILTLTVLYHQKVS